ncbi:hypothetical protein [Chthonobacter rhizosphaerae]|uniref:hypothetical protein n=1 Tax=Chthonobacter rhizosphaerae TaxID=2735553 RepID=UPI0015EFCED9|nr:hypothetical protein [Chthonobacter rhizosphaerae]
MTTISLAALVPVTVLSLAIPALAGTVPPKAATPAFGLAAAPMGNDRTAPPAFQIPREGWPTAEEPADVQEGGDVPPEPDVEPETATEPPASPPDGPLPDIRYGVGDLPEPVARTRQALIDAARTGDPDRLAEMARAAPEPPALSSIDGGEPLDLLVAQSGDPEGREILAILLDVLDAGFVEVEDVPGRKKFVWPYFARMPADRLTPPQMVELFRIITAGDFDEMKNAGTYVFYRVEIDADGRWLAFLAGE